MVYHFLSPMKQKLFITLVLGLLITVGLSATTSASGSTEIKGTWGTYDDTGGLVPNGYFEGLLYTGGLFEGEIYSLQYKLLGWYTWYLHDDGTFNGYVYQDKIWAPISGTYSYDGALFKASWTCKGVNGWSIGISGVG